MHSKKTAPIITDETLGKIASLAKVTNKTKLLTVSNSTIISNTQYKNLKIKLLEKFFLERRQASQIFMAREIKKAIIKPKNVLSFAF